MVLSKDLKFEMMDYLWINDVNRSCHVGVFIGPTMPQDWVRQCMNWVTALIWLTPLKESWAEDLMISTASSHSGKIPHNTQMTRKTIQDPRH
jgi:hypothetical protein